MLCLSDEAQLFVSICGQNTRPLALFRWFNFSQEDEAKTTLATRNHKQGGRPSATETLWTVVARLRISETTIISISSGRFMSSNKTNQD
jgi:hypothetical protein